MSAIVVKNISKENFREHLLSTIKRTAWPQVLSISLVGSFQKKRPIRKVDDVDLVIVVPKLTSKEYLSLSKKFKQIAKKITTPEIKVVIERRIAGIKPRRLKRKYIIQLHLLIYDSQKWKQSFQKPSLFDWTNFNKLLYGNPLSSIKKVDRIDARGLAEDLQGKIFNALHPLKIERGKGYRIRLGKLEKTSTKVFKENTSERVVHYILVSFLNYARYLNPKTPNEKNLLLKKAKRILPLKYQKILGETFFLKEKLKAGENISKARIKKLLRDGADFMGYILHQIKNDCEGMKAGICW